MLPTISDSTLRLTRRSLIISSAAAAALLATPGRTFGSIALAAQTPIAGAGTFLDPSLVHDVFATFDQADYDAVIASYKESGAKEWLKASLTIDDQTFEEVGLRLKGNSSLMALREDLGLPGDGNPINAQPAITVFTEEGTPSAGGSDERTMVMGGLGGNISADEPQGLPWLVRLDKFVEDQNLDGLYEFVIRSSNSETALNEAVALQLLTEAGLASQAAAFIRFSTNDSEPRLRIAIENPDDIWLAAHFSEHGALFKSEAEGNWSYRDENWDSYVESFDLEAGGRVDDAETYAPLISFLDFINNSDDATFNSDLPARLDIEQFATYLAMMDLIQNGDAIDGPGNNSYLYYDVASGMFTVVPWDMNLAFGGMMSARGFAQPFQGGSPAEGQGMAPEGVDGPVMVIDGTPVAAEDMPGRIEGDPRQVGGPGDMGRIGGMNNPLVTRWDANTDFQTLQATTQDRLRSELFESGLASEILARWVAVLETHATDLVDQSTIDSEAQRMQEQIDAA